MRNLFYLSSAIFAISTGLTKANQLELTKSNDVFRNKLDEILSENTTDNIVFSPLSLHTALSVMYLGSEGRTRKAFKDVMNLSEPKETAADYEALFNSLRLIKTVTMEVATKLFVSSAVRLLNEFRGSALRYYSAEEENVNFEDSDNAAATINKWVSEKTRGKITETVDPASLGSLTVLVLINVVYFKGHWLHPFEHYHGFNLFRTSETSSHGCQLMYVENSFDYSESKDLDAKILRLSYTDEQFGLIIVLPNKITGYLDLEKKLRKMDSSVFKDLKREYGTVVLPKFKIEKEIHLIGPLSKLGLGGIFSSGAEFPHIADIPLIVTEVKQKLFLNVDTNGTEAAAVTSIIAETLSLVMHPTPKFNFTADHPFLFFLEYSTSGGSHILFQGRVADV